MRQMSKRFRLRGVSALVLGLALVAAACSDDDGGITVGAFNFPESNILAQIYGQALEAGDVDVSIEEDFGARPVVLDALEDGGLDIVPEYVGALLNELEGPDTATSDLGESIELLDEALTSVDLAAFDASEAETVDALAVTEATADELGLETYSDLAAVAGDLTFGGPAECAKFPACIPGLRDVYGIEFGEFVPLEPGPPIFEALNGGDVDVARVFSTDAAIAENGWVVLEDDEGLNPVQNVIPVANEDADSEEIADISNAVSAALTTEALIELNGRVITDKDDPEDVARDWLEENDLI